VGIDINNAANGVKLSRDLHTQRGLHTEKAINEVVRRLFPFRGNKEKIVKELQKIGAEQRTDTFNYPR
jgi:hypothetical protein